MGNLVSIIIPTFYRNERLKCALDSALRQDYSEFEVIVVDDSGESAARQVVEEYDSVTYIPHSENSGAPTARATGLENASGRYIQYLDDDDKLHPAKIRRQVELFRSTDVGVVYCGARFEHGPSYPVHRGEVLREALKLDLVPCNTPTMLVERDRYESLKPLDRYQSAQDIWFKIALAQETKFDFVDDLLVDIGRPSRSLFESPETPQSIKQIICDYQDLYDQFPRDVQNAALAKTYHFEANAHLSQQFWSLNAIRAFWRAYNLAPENKSSYLPPLLLSLFGRWGRNIGRKFA